MRESDPTFLDPRQRAALDAVGHAVVVSTPDGVILVWNRAAEDVFGWTADEAIGRDRSDLLGAPPSPTETRALLQRVLTGESWQGHFSTHHKDGTELELGVTITSFVADGEHVAIVATIHDVTSERRENRARERDAAHLRLALDAGGMGTWSWDLRTDAVMWDAAMSRRFGLDGPFVGTFDDYLASVHPDDRESTVAAVQKAAGDGTDPLHVEHRAVWPDGSLHWIEGRGLALRDDDGELVGMVGIGIDIDERRRVQEIEAEAAALRASAAIARRLEAAERIAHLGSWTWDVEGDLVRTSTNLRSMLPVGTELSGGEFRDLLERVTIPEDRGQVLNAPTSPLAEGGAFRIEHRVRTGSGPVRHLIHRVELVRDGDAIIELQGTTQDITDRRETEQLLARERRAVEMLHDSLLRNEHPELPGLDIAAQYLAADNDTEIGGDWYDAFELPDGRLMFAVGDISGHGLRSARLMAKMRHATRAYACLDASPQVVVDRLDHFLEHLSTSDEFASMLFGLYEPDTHVVELISAGHIPPLLVTADDAQQVAMHTSRVVGIGIVALAPKIERFTLEPGEALLCFTDGLVERRRELLDDGVARLASVRLGPEMTASELCRTAIASGLGGHARADDVCVLAIVRQA